jgi:hypothetical protein
MGILHCLLLFLYEHAPELLETSMAISHKGFILVRFVFRKKWVCLKIPPGRAPPASDIIQARLIEIVGE